MENESLRGFIGAAVAKDPLIFSKSLHTQMDTLLINPVEILRVKDPPQFKALPFAILIDGLDECSGEDRQAELLSAIKRCFLDRPNVPFRLFLASRPELAIRSALQPGGYLHEVTYHLQLSDNYDATADIRRYLWRRLREAGARSSDPRARFQSWPRESDINALVCAALGQFIYAATVIKYVLDPRSSPYDRLANAVKWASGDRPKSSNPFSSIDLLYRNILKNAKDAYDAVNTKKDDFMLIIRSYQLISMLTEARNLTLPKFNLLLDLAEGTYELILSDVRSLITTYPDAMPEEYGPPQPGIRFYHRSFLDYIGDESRSQEFYVSIHRVWGNLLSLCMDRAFRYPVETKHIAEHLKDKDPLTAARINERVDRWNKEPPVQGINDACLLQEFKSVWSKNNPGRLFEELEQPDPEIPVYDRFIACRL
ncbi:hypothetical protein EST38_g2967 [Candolleomyces aberdarensis]|uniref:NACHT domain-containing protein n=1 Tax=Candolleomyces aberdarensis TaxID=2316362 RepID=A0A4Q2DUU8_9AGAR|nr:hypothetical protein EST38_g2967 [Candolleomyces aberdarensis]